LSVGTVEFAMGLTIAEIVYPDYSVSGMYISDLGVGTAAAPIFNGSIIILGLLLVLCSWFLFRGYRDRILMVALAVAGVGAAGVGIFTEGSPFGLHSAFSLVTFVFAALATIPARSPRRGRRARRDLLETREPSADRLVQSPRRRKFSSPLGREGTSPRRVHLQRGEHGPGARMARAAIGDPLYGDRPRYGARD